MAIDFGLQLQSFSPAGQGDTVSFYRRVVQALSPEFTTLWVSDHLQFGNEPSLEGWTRLTYLAALFPHLRVGHLVLGQGYRNPALLAKMGATLQHLTGGRFILGIGAGWHEEEYRAYGYGYPSRGARVEQLAEAIQIIRALWTESPATFRGAHYSIENAYCEPRPDPVPPILVGSPSPRVIGVAARYADGWSWDGPMEVYGPPHAELTQACAQIGRDPGSIWLTAAAEVNFPDDPATFKASYSHSFYPGKVFPILGPTPADAIKQLGPMVELGVRHLQILPYSLRTLEQFCAEVVPALTRIASAGTGGSSSW